MTNAEMLRAKGYTVEFNDSDQSLTVFQNGERVAALSPNGKGGYYFDWHRHDQWHLCSHYIMELAFEINNGS